MGKWEADRWPIKKHVFKGWETTLGYRTEEIRSETWLTLPGYF